MSALAGGYTDNDRIEDVCRSISSCLDFSNLQCVHLDFTDNFQALEASNNTPKLWSMLRTISMPLREFQVIGLTMVGPDILWPSGISSSGPTTDDTCTDEDATKPVEPFWPNLERLYIRHEPDTKNTGDPLAGQDSWFRSVPDFRFCRPLAAAAGPGSGGDLIRTFYFYELNEELSWLDLNWVEPIFHQVIIAASRALLNMPRLQKMIIGTCMDSPHYAYPGFGYMDFDDPTVNYERVLATLPFYYNRETAVSGSESSNDSFGPTTRLTRLSGWTPPVEAVQNWRKLRGKLLP